MPEELRARIEARAAATNRSSNAEIVVMLTEMLDAESELGAVSLETLLKAVAERMGSALQINVTAPAEATSHVKSATRKRSK